AGAPRARCGPPLGAAPNGLRHRASAAVRTVPRAAAALAAPRAPAGAAGAAVGPAARRARPAAGADRGQLLRRLADHVRVLGEAQADAAALAVDLDDLDLDLVALVEHLLDAADALAGRHVGDVQQAVGALRQLDEGAEGR